MAAAKDDSMMLILFRSGREGGVFAYIYYVCVAGVWSLW